MTDLVNLSQDDSTESGAQSTEEQFGDQVQGEDSVQLENQRKFQATLERMANCLQVSGGPMPESSPVAIETLYQKFQADFGPVVSQADRWVTWHLRGRDGKERRLRLEIIENDLGHVSRELHLFAVDRSGQPNPVEVDPEKSLNPSDEVINEMLNEGEVFTKENAAISFFTNGERVEYIKKDNELFEIEFFRENARFRCPNVLIPENCRCL